MLSNLTVMLSLIRDGGGKGRVDHLRTPPCLHCPTYLVSLLQLLSISFSQITVVVVGTAVVEEEEAGDSKEVSLNILSHFPAFSNL